MERKEKRATRGGEEGGVIKGVISIIRSVELYPRIRGRRRIGGGRHKADHGGQRTLPIAKITHRPSKKITASKS